MKLNILTTASAIAALALAAHSQSASDVTTGNTLQSFQPGLPSSGGGGGGWSATNYQWDDGGTEGMLGWNNGGTMCMIHRFDVAGGGQDTITKVMASFGSPTGASAVAAGSQVRVFVWDDPNDDNNPYDCVLLTTATGVTNTPNMDIFEDFPVPATAVTNRFYVGVDIDAPVGTFPASRDFTVIVPDVAWLSGSLTPGGYTGIPINGTHNLSKASSFTWACNWLLRAEGGNHDVVYCTAKVNSLGCTPSIGSTGLGSATAPNGHNIKAVQVRNNKNGLLFYGTTGQTSTPFQGGTLCVKVPVRRTGAVQSGGNPAPANDCSGAYQIDMNTFAQSSGPPVPLAALKVPGTVVNCQFWGRDPGFPAPNNTTLSDGLQYTVGP